MNTPEKRPGRPRRSVLYGAASLALALIGVFVIQLARADLPPQVVSSPSPSASIAPSASVAPRTSASAAPTSQPTAAPLPPSSAVHISKTLPASGQFALILRRNMTTSVNPQGGLVTGPPARDSLVAVPLNAPTRTGQVIPLLDFASIVGQTGPVAFNLIREQLSPDGHRIVLSVKTGDDPTARLSLVIVDLLAGTVSALTNDPESHDQLPVWSPRGDLIAFIRRPTALARPAERGTLWVVRPDGGDARQLLGPPDYPEVLGVFGWNGDGTRIGLFRGAEGSPYYLFDPATGTSFAIGGGFALFGPQADWREGSPAYVGAFTESPRGGTQNIVTADQRGGSATTIVTLPSVSGAYFQGPRWRPGSDDILYVLWSGNDPTGTTARNTLFVTDASGKQPRIVATGREMNMFAAWTADGRDILYLTAAGVGGRLALVAPDGSNERVVQDFGGVPEANPEWLGLAVLSL